MKTALEWYLIYTEPNCEYTAAYWLQRQGFMTFLPEYRARRRRRRDPSFTVELPVFPSYLFVGQGVGEGRFKTIEDQRGVLRLVGVGGAPLRVPDAVIGELRAATKNQQFIEDDKRGGVRYVRQGVTAAELARVKLGDDVLVTDGPFASFIGHVVRIGGRGELGVLLDLFNKKTLVRFSEMQVQPVQTVDTGQANQPRL